MSFWSGVGDGMDVWMEWVYNVYAWQCNEVTVWYVSKERPSTILPQGSLPAPPHPGATKLSLRLSNTFDIVTGFQGMGGRVETTWVAGRLLIPLGSWNCCYLIQTWNEKLARMTYTFSKTFLYKKEDWKNRGRWPPAAPPSGSCSPSRRKSTTVRCV